MIDLHFHPLPGIDDGPRDWESAVALCRAAAADGVREIVATPHVLRDPWWNEDPAARRALVEELNARLGGSPRVHEGCEMWFTDELVDLAEQRSNGSALTTLGRSRYVLVEFHPLMVPRGVASAFHELKVLGLVPLIAHPERNAVFAREPETLVSLVSAGAVVQVTAGSLVGDFGRAAREAADDFVEAGLAHVVASDSHDVKKRPCRMSAARERVRKLWGAEVEGGLFEANPAAVLADEALPFNSLP